MATSASVIFGQLVIGAPGAGKTTYCEAMSRFLKGQEISKGNLVPSILPKPTQKFLSYPLKRGRTRKNKWPFLY